MMTAKIFGMRIFHEDLWELLFKFGMDVIVLFVLIRLIYYPIHRKKDHLFTYFLFNILIFFLCVLLNNVKLSTGFAFGLFAVFSVLRYRTEQISIKDMTYLFAVIALAVINALVSKKISLAELLFTDGMILTDRADKLQHLDHNRVGEFGLAHDVGQQRLGISRIGHLASQQSGHDFDAGQRVLQLVRDPCGHFTK